MDSAKAPVRARVTEGTSVTVRQQQPLQLARTALLLFIEGFQRTLVHDDRAVGPNGGLGTAWAN